MIYLLNILIYQSFFRLPESVKHVDGWIPFRDNCIIVYVFKRVFRSTPLVIDRINGNYKGHMINYMLQKLFSIFLATPLERVALSYGR